MSQNIVGYLIILWNSDTVLKINIGSGVDPGTSWQELAIERMKDPVVRIEKHTGKSREVKMNMKKKSHTKNSV